MLEYKGYTGRIEFDDEAMLFHGEVIGLSDMITFQGTSVEELKEEFRDSIDDYLEFCEERGEEPDKPYSGRFVLRLPTELHRAVDMRARYEGKSLNQWILEVLEKAVSTKKTFFSFSLPDDREHQTQPGDFNLARELAGLSTKQELMRLVTREDWLPKSNPGSTQGDIQTLPAILALIGQMPFGQAAQQGVQSTSQPAQQSAQVVQEAMQQSAQVVEEAVQQGAQVVREAMLQSAAQEVTETSKRRDKR